jgi:NADH-quinone oxidoreductase subunit D
MVRGSGAAWDLRKAQPYECYSELDFDIPIGKNGDCYDRYLIRMQEMRQSVKIMKQCVEQLLGKEKVGGFGHRRQDRAAQARRDEAVDGSADPSLQALHRRLHVPEGESTPPSKRRRASSASIWCRTAPTSPTAARSARPAMRTCRRWISSAAATMLADVSAALGSLDIVFGEVDR